MTSCRHYYQNYRKKKLKKQPYSKHVPKTEITNEYKIIFQNQINAIEK